MQISVDNTTWYDQLDKVHGDATSGKYVTAGAYPIPAIPGAYYRAGVKTGDYTSGSVSARVIG